MIKYIQIGSVVLKIDIKKESKVINGILKSFKSAPVKKSDGVIIFKSAKETVSRLQFIAEPINVSACGVGP